MSNRRVVGYLMFSGIEIENANALSGNLVYGIPAITGIKGSFHNMSRKIMESNSTSAMKTSLRGVMVACHDYKILASRSKEYSNYRFMQQRMSIMTKADLTKLNSGTLPSITEQAYCYVKMSFIVEVVCDRDLDDLEKKTLSGEAYKIIQQNRIAGGSVKPFKDKSKVSFVEYENLDTASYKLSNAPILTDATNEMYVLLNENPDKSAIDILIDISSNVWTPTTDSDEKIRWKSRRIGSNLGWLVPMNIGYRSITRKFDANEVTNCRHSSAGAVPSSYVEAVYGLGKWVNPHVLRINESLRDAFWCYEYKQEQSLYLITTQTNQGDINV